MTWLLWREYRLNRQIVATCAVLLLLSCAFDFCNDLDRDDLIAPDGFFVLLVSALTLALVGGNSIAAERADRSAEFVAYLPLPRWRRLASKLFLPLTGVVVIGAVDLLTLMRQVGNQPIQKQPESLHIFGLVASVALLICGVSWLVSSIQSSAALATMSGMFAAGFSAFAAGLTGTLNEVAPTFSEPGWWFTLNFSVAIVCFCIGSWYYLRESNPYAAPARGERSTS